MNDLKRMNDTAPADGAEFLEGKELFKKLCLTFGPSGDEDAVSDEICAQLQNTSAEVWRDRRGDVFAVRCGSGEGYNEAAPRRVMLSAHMDEVGFMVKYIEDDGYLRFSCVGGIDERVLCGRHVVLSGKNGMLPGVIASKAIHHQTREEMKTSTKVKDMYIDIGAVSRADAEKYVEIGTWGTFDSAYVEFGEENRFVKSKAIDDRLGCFVILETLRRLDREKIALPFDVIGAFTTCEEIGKSGALLAAQRFEPDCAVVLEATAIADLPDVKPSSRVSAVGEGGTVSLLDRSTIYDRGLVDLALQTAKEKNIPVQIKKYVSGGNDAGHIHKAGRGCRVLAISNPTRYIHSAACVAAFSDIDAIRELVFAVLCGMKI